MDATDHRQDRPRKAFIADLIPGLTTSAVVVPKALAYATIAQLPVQAGLFAALVPMAVYAALGSSRLLSVSTTTPIAILCATAIGEGLSALGRRITTSDESGQAPADSIGEALQQLATSVVEPYASRFRYLRAAQSDDN